MTTAREDEPRPPRASASGCRPTLSTASFFPSRSHRVRPVRPLPLQFFYNISTLSSAPLVGRTTSTFPQLHVHIPSGKLSPDPNDPNGTSGASSPVPSSPPARIYPLDILKKRESDNALRESSPSVPDAKVETPRPAIASRLKRALKRHESVIFDSPEAMVGPITDPKQRAGVAAPQADVADDQPRTPEDDEEKPNPFKAPTSTPYTSSNLVPTLPPAGDSIKEAPSHEVETPSAPTNTSPPLSPAKLVQPSLSQGAQVETSSTNGEIVLGPEDRKVELKPEAKQSADSEAEESAEVLAPKMWIEDLLTMAERDA